MSFALQREGRFRHVALDQFGRLAGYAALSHELHGQPMKPGQQFLDVRVKPEYRGQGIGRALLAAAEQEARQNGVTSLMCAVAPGDDAALAFAARHGFTFDWQTMDGALDLGRFDPTPWADAVAHAEASGIRFTTLLQAQEQPDVLKKLYELDHHLSRDVPEWSGVMPSVEAYRASLQECDPEAVLIAWDGQHAVGYSMTSADGYTCFMGVAQAYRGRGIAKALKVLTIEWARRKGLARLTTNNNAASAAIVSLNRELGYSLQLGAIYLVKEVPDRLKILKDVAKTAGSLALFVGLYVWWQGWWYGAGIGAIFLIHELGHVWAGRMRLIPISAPIFIPFIGAFVTWKRRPPNAYDEAFIAAGGPVAGLLASAAAWGAGMALQQHELVNVAYLGFAIHIFNMIPILPFDGGRIAKGVSRWIGYLFTPVFVFYCLWQDRAWLLGALWPTLLTMVKPSEDDGYYQVSPAQRGGLAGVYGGLLGIALLGVVATGGPDFIFPWLRPTPTYHLVFSLWLTGVVTAIYLVWRFGRPIWGPWVTPVPRGRGEPPSPDDER